MTLNITPEEKIIEEFYSTFAGNKFEASFKRIKRNGDKVEAFCMDDFLREKLQEHRKQVISEIRQNIEKKYPNYLEDYHNEVEEIIDLLDDLL